MLICVTNVALLNAQSTVLTETGCEYHWDSGRLQTVRQGEASAVYSYVANSTLVSNIAFSHSSQPVMITTRHYDLLNRLTTIESSGAGFQPVSFGYQYNSANQRTTLTNADNSRWSYSYDELGQVTSGKKYWSDGMEVIGQQFGYAFDDIGNRQTTTRDGQQSDYTANALNQYTSRTVPGYVNMIGSATNAATVTVWTEDGLVQTTRHDDYFRAEVAVSNAAPLWLAITNIAVLQQGTNADIIATNMGSLLIAETPENFTYDLDGNLTSDSLWTNVWNGENRRTNIESRSSVPASGKVREQWTHLPDGRWIERIVSTNNGSGYVAMLTNRFVWDGNVLLAVLTHTNGLELAFMRGLDLSGTLQGAGGVGGLLAVQVGPAGSASLMNTTHFAAYDGNGNVAGLVNAADGTESARYENGPFAEPLRMTGPMAKVNPIRFSTQYADDFTGDLKYLHRDLRDGRWRSRDPIEENGGLNLYGFVRNQATVKSDYLGNSEFTGAEILTKYIERVDLALVFLPLGIPINMHYKFYAFSADEIVKSDTLGSRNQVYFKKAERQMTSSGWQTVDATDYDADKLADFSVTRGLTGFVLSQPHSVASRGTFEACRRVGKSYLIRNVQVKWSWFDEMDANSWKESAGKGNNVRIIEAIVDGIADKILQANFNFEVNFSDEEGDRSIVGFR